MCENKKSQANIIETNQGKIIKTWTKDVPFEEAAKQQLINISKLPFIYKWVSAMPDVHAGDAATVGSVIPTIKAVIPAAVDVDIGCGMMACQTSLKAKDLPLNLKDIRNKIELMVPVGACSHREVNSNMESTWRSLRIGFEEINLKYEQIDRRNKLLQLGTLGGGNHFIEICLDEDDRVWVMLHSGSRGIGHAIGTFFIARAKEEMQKWFVQLPHDNLAYLPEGSKYFKDYLNAVFWAQEYAKANRILIMNEVLSVLKSESTIPDFQVDQEAINCHHNYVAREHHFKRNVYVTRKGAISARKGELGIIPGSMGARSYIVEGLGNEESFNSCSHGAGRAMSITEARDSISLDEHINATKGVECRKDEGVLEESPRAYKDIDAVMDAQSDLVKVKHTLKQILCVKG